MDMFSTDNEPEFSWLWDSNHRRGVGVSFRPVDAVYDVMRQSHAIEGELLTIRFDNDYDDFTDEEFEQVKKLIPSYMTIKRATQKPIHYAV
jgi:hypothetical protein